MTRKRPVMTAAKLASISAAVLLLSLGLCGANFLLVLRFDQLAGPAPQPGQPVPPQWPGTVLTITGVLELVGIALGTAGLFTALWRKLWT